MLPIGKRWSFRLTTCEHSTQHEILRHRCMIAHDAIKCGKIPWGVIVVCVCSCPRGIAYVLIGFFVFFFFCGMGAVLALGRVDAALKSCAISVVSVQGPLGSRALGKDRQGTNGQAY